MAYSLSLEDIGGAPQPQGASNGYQLSLNDIAPQAPVQPAAAPQQERSFMNNLGRHGAAVMGSFGRDLGNLPNTFNKNIPTIADPNFDYYKAMGVEQNLGDDIAKGALDFAPYLMGGTGLLKAASKIPQAAKAIAKAPNLIKNVLAGTAFGAANAPVNDNGERDRGVNAALGGALGAAGVGLGKLGEFGVKKGAEMYAKTAIPGLVKKASEAIKNYALPEAGANKIMAGYKVAADKNKALWGLARDSAQMLDKSLVKNKTVEAPSKLLDAQGRPIMGQATKQVVDFDNSPFKTSINNYLSRIRKMEPAEKAKYKNAMGFSKYIKKLSPQSFNGAVELRQNLNQELKGYLEKNNIKMADRETRSLIRGLQKDLKTTVKQNAGKVDPKLFKGFLDSWKGANKQHQAVQEFYKRPNAENILKPTRERREALQIGQLDRAAIGSYLRPSLGGETGLDQLKKLSGSDDAARSYLMRNVIEGRGTPKAPLLAYNKLSIPQRERLFDALPEGAQLKAASAAKSAFGEVPSMGWGSVSHHIGSLGAPGAIGFLGALGAGENWDKAMLYGAGASVLGKLAGSTASKYATPNTVMKAIKYAKKPIKNSGRYVSPLVVPHVTPKEEKQ